jgi:predicted transcriptional regulator
MDTLDGRLDSSAEAALVDELLKCPRFNAAIKEAEEALDRGEFATDAEVAAVFSKWISPPRNK